MNDPLAEFELVVSETKRAGALRDLEASGADVRRSGEPYEPGDGDPSLDDSGSSFEPLVVIIALVAVADLLERVLRLVEKVEKLRSDTKDPVGWIVLDLRGERLRIRYIPSPDSATLVVVRNSGISVRQLATEEALREELQRVLDESA